MTKGEHTKTYTAKQIDKAIARGKDQTDWTKVDAMTDEKLEQLIAEDPDEAEADPDWTKARLVLPQRKQQISIRVDADVLHWFKQYGKGYQRKMQAVLRTYMEAHKHDSPG